jgi:hypothetical protein
VGTPDWPVGQPFSLHTTEAQARTIFAIYALKLIAISAEILLGSRAWQLREPLRLNARTIDDARRADGLEHPVSVGPVSLVFLYFADEQSRAGGFIF